MKIALRDMPRKIEMLENLPSTKKNQVALNLLKHCRAAAINQAATLGCFSTTVNQDQASDGSLTDEHAEARTSKSYPTPSNEI